MAMGSVRSAAMSMSIFCSPIESLIILRIPIRSVRFSFPDRTRRSMSPPFFASSTREPKRKMRASGSNRRTTATIAVFSASASLTLTCYEPGKGEVKVFDGAWPADVRRSSRATASVRKARRARYRRRAWADKRYSLVVAYFASLSKTCAMSFSFSFRICRLAPCHASSASCRSSRRPDPALYEASVRS